VCAANRVIAGRRAIRLMSRYLFIVLQSYNAIAQLRGALACPPWREVLIAPALAPKGRYASVACQLRRLVRQILFSIIILLSFILS
jgi:hypothetical protein